MNYTETIDQFVAAFGFSYHDQYVMATDLKKIVAAQFLINLMEKYPSREEVVNLRKVVDMEDHAAAERLLTQVFRSSEYHTEIKEITELILSSWAQSMRPTLTIEQQSQIEPALAMIK